MPPTHRAEAGRGPVGQRIAVDVSRRRGGARRGRQEKTRRQQDPGGATRHGPFSESVGTENGTPTPPQAKRSRALRQVAGPFAPWPPPAEPVHSITHER